jgi:hypothetical protein
MSLLQKANRRLFLFGLFKIPMIRYCRPKIVQLDNQSISIKIPFRRRTRNHVNSMYFGAMSVGADLASGFLAYHLFEVQGVKASLVFAGAQSTFSKRAEGDVYFQCSSGKEIQEMIQESSINGERITRTIPVACICMDERVAEFQMQLSLKVKS